MSKTRYASLDTFKTVSALLVVCLHAKLPDNRVADIILVLARIAVPYFFLCSGFFAYRDWDICAETRKKRLHTLLRHILILFGVIIIYVIANRFILKRSIPNIIKILSLLER